ncbi:DNA primase, partial [Listeria monocytogenes]|nr:DNA primase [Listeria monocytogenes]
SSNANSDIARLHGARFVTTTEPNEGVRLDEGLVKQLTGGDKVTARHLYKDEFEFTPEFKIWMATNHKPIIRGRDDGIWRRLHLVPFTVKIPDEKVD